MPKDAVVSAYGFEQIKKQGSKLRQNDEAEEGSASLQARDHVAEAFYGRFGDRAGTERLRQRIFWMAARLEGPRVLDIGTSEGVLPLLAAREGYDVTGLDINEEAIAYANGAAAAEPDPVRDRLRYIAADFTTYARSVGEAGELFDTVVAGEVIEHLVAPDAFIETCAALTRPGGVLVLSTPFGVNPDPDHKVSLFPSDLAGYLNGRFAPEEFEVEGGYIRILARRQEGAAKCAVDALLQIAEAGAYHSQVNALRILDERRQQIVNLTAEAAEATDQVAKIRASTYKDLADTKAAAAKSIKDLREELEDNAKNLDKAAADRDATVRQLSERDAQLAALQERILSMQANARDLEQRLASKQTALAALKNQREREQVLWREAEAESGEVSEALALLRDAGLGISPKIVLQPSAKESSDVKAGTQNGSLVLEQSAVNYFTHVHAGRTYTLTVRPDRTPRTKQEAVIVFTFLDADGTPMSGPVEGAVRSKTFNAYRYLDPNQMRNGVFAPKIKAPSGAVSLRIELLAWRPESSPLSVREAITVQEHNPDAVVAVEKLRTSHGRLTALLTSGAAAVDSREAGTPAVASKVDTPPALLSEVAPSVGRSLRAISVLDEMSELNWSTVMDLERLGRTDFAAQIAATSADFLFLESAWKGNDSAWEYAFTSPGLKHQNAQDLLAAVEVAKAKDLPVVFWNKEDPMHYDKFLPYAKKADVVLTTDAKVVPRYREDTDANTVAVMPFGANPAITNPSGRFATGRDPGSICFAGSYYAANHEDRKEQMNALLPVIPAFGGVIYDRMSYTGSDRYAYPEPYRPFIRPAVPFSEIVDEYKRFKLFLNVNTITDSPTMMSRRVYEIMACGTPVISYPSQAIEAQFGDLVATATTGDEAVKAASDLLGDDLAWRKRSQRGMRAVLSAHTYQHRKRGLGRAAGIEIEDERPLVSIILASKRPKFARRIKENLSRQRGVRYDVHFALGGAWDDDAKALLRSIEGEVDCEGIRFHDLDPNTPLGTRYNAMIAQSAGSFIAKMDDDDFYFDNYLADQMLCFSFGDYDAVGKQSVHMLLEGSDKLIWRVPHRRHCETDFVTGATLVMRRRVFEKTAFSGHSRGEDTRLLKAIGDYGGKVYSSDEFNFVVYRAADQDHHTWKEADEKLLRNAVVMGSSADLDKARC